MKWLFSFILATCLAFPANAQISAQSYVVMDQDGYVLFQKNPDDVRPIASITKLYSLSHIVPISQPINITESEIDRLKNTRMRLRHGSYDELELVDAALSASNNEAAKSLGKAHWLSYQIAQKKFPDVYMVEPSGLDPNNRASAMALARSAFEIAKLPIAEHTLKTTMFVGKTGFRNTNPLLNLPGWDFKLSKTGFINEAGGCLIVVMTVAGRDYSIAILGSKDTRQRWKDLSQLRGLISEEPYFKFASPISKSRKKK